MKVTNIIPLKNALHPCISFEAAPELARVFQGLGMIFSDPSTGNGRHIWVLYPDRDFDHALKFIQEYEQE